LIINPRLSEALYSLQLRMRQVGFFMTEKTRGMKLIPGRPERIYYFDGADKALPIVQAQNQRN